VVPGWTKGTLKVTAGPRSQQGTILVSNDGRYLLRGEPVDLTVDPLQAIRAKINLSNQPSRGPADAPVTVVEYSDFQCPYCAKASAIVEHDLLTAYPDKVRLVHKSFPLTNIHPWAMSAAIAARCAFEQNNEAYWVLYEAFFSEQKTITPANVKDKALAAARRTTIDLALFETCYDGKATAAAVQADVAEGNAVGVNSTPTFFVNGRRIAGAAPLESFRAAVDAELAAR
jgi:protein-disulfide isomerase